MSTYNIRLTNSSGNITPVVRRSPTAPSGGTAVPVQPFIMFPATDGSTKLIGLAYQAAFYALRNDWVANGPASYDMTITDDGSGNFVPTVIRAGTAGSGGTVLTIPAAELFPSTATLSPEIAGQASFIAVRNDRASGN